MEENGTVDLNGVVSIRPEQLPTSTICFREGIRDDSSFEAEGSEMISSINGTFDRGSFRGRFASVLMIRWLASRRESAETIWFTVNDGFIGTCRAGRAVNIHIGLQTPTVRNRLTSTAPSLNSA